MQSFRSSLLSFIRSLANLCPLSWMWPKNALNIKYLFAFQWKMQWIDDINPLLLLRKNIKHCCVICSSSHAYALFHHVLLQQTLNWNKYSLSPASVCTQKKRKNSTVSVPLVWQEASMSLLLFNAVLYPVFLQNLCEYRTVRANLCIAYDAQWLIVNVCG